MLLNVIFSTLIVWKLIHLKCFGVSCWSQSCIFPKTIIRPVLPLWKNKMCVCLCAYMQVGFYVCVLPCTHTPSTHTITNLASGSCWGPLDDTAFPLCWSPGIKFHFWKHLDVHISHEVTIFRAVITQYVTKNMFVLQERLFLHLWKRIKGLDWTKGADIENVWSPQCEHAHPPQCVPYLTGPDHNQAVGPDWLEPFTCTVVLLHLHSCPVSPHHPGPKITALFAQALSG